MRYKILLVHWLHATVSHGYITSEKYESNHKEVFIINQYTNIHHRNYQMLLTNGSSMCHHREMVSVNNKSNKVRHKLEFKSTAQRMVVLLSPMSHSSSYSQITVVVCSPNEFLSRVAAVAGLLVRSHHSPNLQSSPIPLVTVTVLSAPTLDSYFLCVA